MIDATVWENYYLRGEVGMVYALFFLNGLLLLNARRERRALLFGRDAGAIDARQVPPELSARIAGLLREGTPFAAIKLYRETKWNARHPACESRPGETAAQSRHHCGGGRRSSLFPLSGMAVAGAVAILRRLWIHDHEHYGSQAKFKRLDTHTGDAGGADSFLDQYLAPAQMAFGVYIIGEHAGRHVCRSCLNHPGVQNTAKNVVAALLSASMFDALCLLQWNRTFHCLAFEQHAGVGNFLHDCPSFLQPWDEFSPRFG